MLKNSEPNPLNIHGLRRTSHCPPHFSQVTFELYTLEKNLTDWVYENLEGRFFSGQVDVAIEGKAGALSRKQCLAFELAGEASYFALMLASLNSANYLIN